MAIHPTIRRMKTKIALKYEGPALEDGQMDVYQTSANMIAFTEFMVVAVKETYGDAAQAKAEVAGFEQGSFITNLVFSVGGALASIFTELTPAQLMEVVKGAFELWKHLKGAPPTEVLPAGTHLAVTNNNGQIITVQTESFTLVMNPTAAEAANRFVRQALAPEGVEKLSIGSESKPVLQVSANEAQYFVPVAPTVQLSDNTNPMVLTVVSPVFQEGNKWRFSDGGATFSAEILDEDFLRRVDSGVERFGKGDALQAVVRIIQTRSGQKISVERHVIRVIQHLNPHQQASLL